MSTLLPPIGARELAPRRPLCKRPRRKVRVRVLQNEFCTPEFFQFFHEHLKGLNAHEKLLMFYMLITDQMKQGQLGSMSAMEFWIDACRYLHVREEKMISAFFGLVRKGILTHPKLRPAAENEGQVQQPQEENQNG